MFETAITTDYDITYRGDATFLLEGAVSAGFSHIHWCHEWCTDFLYSPKEIDRISSTLHRVGLALLDLHASAGDTHYYASEESSIRKAGIGLVRNRIEMTSVLGGDAIVLHPPGGRGESQGAWTAILHAFDDLIPFAEARNVRIALENMPNLESWEMIRRIRNHYQTQTIGLCYDSGHGNMIQNGLGYLEQMPDCVYALHLHDNNALSDQHLPPFRGVVEWDRLCRFLSACQYVKPLALETSSRNAGDISRTEYLVECHDAGQILTGKVKSFRESLD